MKTKDIAVAKGHRWRLRPGSGHHQAGYWTLGHRWSSWTSAATTWLAGFGDASALCASRRHEAAVSNALELPVSPGVVIVNCAGTRFAY